MLLLTAYSQFSIIPHMDTARESVGGNVNAVAADNPGRQIFDRLHQRSTHVEGLVLLCGLAALVATAHWSRNDGASKPGRPHSGRRSVNPDPVIPHLRPDRLARRF